MLMITSDVHVIQLHQYLQIAARLEQWTLTHLQEKHKKYQHGTRCYNTSYSKHLFCISSGE